MKTKPRLDLHQARNPSLAVCGPRRSCGGAVLGRFGVVSDGLCQLGHCCRKGVNNGPQVPTGLLGRAVMRVCRVSSWRFDFGCRLLAWGIATTTNKLIGGASPTSSHRIPQDLQINGVALVPPNRLEDSKSCRFPVKHANYRS